MNESMSGVNSFLRTAFPIFFGVVLCEFQLPRIVNVLVCICQKGMRGHSK